MYQLEVKIFTTEVLIKKTKPNRKFLMFQIRMK